MENKWQPIETAPKDGTKVLCFGSLPGRKAIFIGWWADKLSSIHYVNDSPGWYNENMDDRDCPSHWMPLPEPPVEWERNNNKGE